MARVTLAVARHGGYNCPHAPRLLMAVCRSWSVRIPQKAQGIQHIGLARGIGTQQKHPWGKGRLHLSLKIAPVRHLQRCEKEAAALALPLATGASGSLAAMSLSP